MFKGVVDIVAITITDAAPRATAIGTPKNINTINKTIIAKLMIDHPFSNAFCFSSSFVPIFTLS